MAHICEMNLHFSSLSTLALFGSPHICSQVTFYLSLKVQYVEHVTLENVSIVLQGHAAAPPLEVGLLLLFQITCHPTCVCV